MKKLIAAAAAAAAATPLVLAAPAHAYAGTPGCVTRVEYQSITNGMTQDQVAARFGIARKPVYGVVTYRYDSTSYKEIDREYRICNSAGRPLPLYEGYVEVDFTNDGYGPLLSSYKSYTAF